MNRKERLIRAIPGMIVGIGMTTLIIWGLTTNNKCDKMLRSEDAVVQVAYADESSKKIVGGNFRIVTIFKTYDREISFRSTELKNLVPEGLPVFVKYIPDCIDCYEFLWDSTVVTEKCDVRYINMKHEWIDYEIIYK
jgi:hypothetical protein